jgi:hypothetical protein
MFSYIDINKRLSLITMLVSASRVLTMHHCPLSSPALCQCLCLRTKAFVCPTPHHRPFCSAQFWIIFSNKQPTQCVVDRYSRQLDRMRASHTLEDGGKLLVETLPPSTPR